MSAPPFLQFYPADYLKDTGRLTTLQHGAYLLLILDYWVNGGLPDDDDQLAAIARLTEEQWAKNRPVLVRFFSDGWVHPRIERDLAKAQEKNTRRSEAGKAGAEARHALGKRDGNANDHSNATSNGAGNASSNGQASSSDIQKDTSLRSVSGALAPRKTRSTKSAIAEDAQPAPDDHEHARKVGMSVEVMRVQWPKFRDHHIAKASKFASWSAAWRTWCAGWVEYGGGRARAGPAKPFVDGVTSILSQFEARRDRADLTEADPSLRTSGAAYGGFRDDVPAPDERAIETDGPGLNLISLQSAPTDDERSMLIHRRSDLWTSLTPIKDRGQGPGQALIERILRMFYAWPTVKLDEMKAVGVAKTYAEQVSHLPLWAIDAGIHHCQAQNDPFPPSAGMVRAAAEAKTADARQEIADISKIVDARVFDEKPRGREALEHVRRLAASFTEGAKKLGPGPIRRDPHPAIKSRYEDERGYDPTTPVTASPELMKKIGG